MITGVQIIAILFAIFMTYLAFINYKKRVITIFEWYLWLFLWIFFSSMTLFPKFLSFLIKPFKVARIMDLLMISAFIILAYLGFSNYIKVRGLEKKIEELVRRIVKNQVQKQK